MAAVKDVRRFSQEYLDYMFGGLGFSVYAILSDFGCDEKSTVNNGMSHNVCTLVSVYFLPFSHKTDPI